MDLQTLRFFVAIAQTGSFTAASDKLNYAQSNISTQIKHLEQELGCPLFYRQKRGILLTSKGEEFYRYATRILLLSDEAVSAMKNMDEPQGQLTIGSLEATAVGSLSRILSDYHSRCPKVVLSVKTDMNDAFFDPILHYELDGAFAAGGYTHPSLIEKLIGHEDLVLVASATIDESDPIRLLAEQSILTFPSGSIFRRRLEALLVQYQIDADDKLITLNSLGAIIANIAAGLGISYLARSVVDKYIKDGGLREYSINDTNGSLAIAFYYRKNHLMDAAFRLFLEML